MTTVSPLAAKERAIANPIPRFPPVTNTTRGEAGEVCVIESDYLLLTRTQKRRDVPAGHRLTSWPVNQINRCMPSLAPKKVSRLTRDLVSADTSPQ